MVKNLALGGIFLALVFGPAHPFSHDAAPAIPAFASTNLHSILFFEQFNTTNNIDIAQTVPAGKNWYITNQKYFNSAFSGCPTGSFPTASWFTANNGILNISTNLATCAGGQVESVGWQTGSSSLTHNFTIPGSGGFYIEGRMQFVPLVTTQFVPDFWMQDITLTQNQIVGSGGGGCEIDIFEANDTPGNSDALLNVVHQWSAWNTSANFQSASANASSIDFTKYHLWGALLTTMAQGGGTGSIQFYLDRVAYGSPITWTSGSTYSICESATFGINFAAQSAPTPLNVNYIIVYGP